MDMQDKVALVTGAARRIGAALAQRFHSSGYKLILHCNHSTAEAEALATVMGILNVVLGVQAVIKQLAEGDVYSAIPRAVGVAAMIASMGVQTGASGSAPS